MISTAQGDGPASCGISDRAQEQFEQVPKKVVGAGVCVRRSYGARLSERFVRLVAPYTRSEYPGRWRLVSALLPRFLTEGALGHWRTGYRRLPADVAEHMALHCRSVAAAHEALAGDLEAYAAEERARPRKLYGMFAIREDGTRGADQNFRR